MLGIIALGGVAIRAYRLSDRSMWFDEAFCWRLIQFPWSEIVARTGRDAHPPFYFVVLKLWAGLFGTSLFALRSLSAFSGELAVVGMYLFVSESFAPGDGQPPQPERSFAVSRAQAMGLFVAALVAVSVFQIRWAGEVRMYTLGTALLAFSSWALFRALHAATRPRRWWALYGLLTLLFAYTHYFALFSIAAQAAFLAGYLLVRGHWDVATMVRSPQVHHALLAGGIVVAGGAPWLPSFLAQRARVKAHEGARPFAGWVVASTCYQMYVDPVGLQGGLVASDGTPDRTYPWIAVSLCIAGFGLVLWRAGAAEWYIVSAAVAPLALAVLISVLDTPVLLYLRYFLFAHLFFLAALGVLVWRVPLRLERGVIAAVILADMLWIDGGWWRALDIAHKPGARAAVALIKAQRRPGEPVVVCSPLLFFSVLYYAADRSAVRVYDDGQPVSYEEGAAILSPRDFINADHLEAVTARRLWVIDGGWGRNRAVPVLDQWVETQRWRFPEVYWFQRDVLVVEYEPRRGRAAPVGPSKGVGGARSRRGRCGGIAPWLE